MPNFPRSARGDVPPVGDAVFEALLAGNLPPEQATDGLRPVAEVIAALCAAPARSEIAAEARAREVYRAAFSRPAPHAPGRRRHPVFASLLSAQIAAAAVLILGAIAAAAWVGVLPAPAQRLAHEVFGAPAAQHSAPAQHPAAATGPNATSRAPTGPDPTGPDAHGLCNAYRHAKAHGNARQKSVAFRNLATAAGGAANITAYCAGVPHPGKNPPGRANPGNANPGNANPGNADPGVSQPGRPTSPPDGQPSVHPAHTAHMQHTSQSATRQG